MRRLLPFLPAVLLAAACSPDDSTPTTPSAPDFAAARATRPGAVATATNDAAGNTLLVYPRDERGRLGDPVSVSTGGDGTSAGLGNQGGITLAANGRFVLVVNAGSNTIAVLRPHGAGLDLVGTTPSGGTMPISITTHDRLVYVLNGGGEGNVTGFWLDGDGRLSPITGSTRPLSGSATGPAQAGLSPDGRLLVVSEKATNILGLYRVRPDGTLGDYTPAPSVGMTPFGFAFDPDGALLVSEAFGGAADASAVSSYTFGRGPSLVTVSPSVGTTETAACWTVVTPDGRFAYVTNAGSNSVSGYAVAGNGAVSLLDTDGVTGQTGGGPIDMALTVEGRRLYTLNGAGQSISGFTVRTDGSLEPIAETGGLPAGANGLVAW